MKLPEQIHFQRYQLQPLGEVMALEQIQTHIGALAADEVLIKVAAASLNYRDLIILRNVGKGSVAGQIPLSDAAGTVVAAGESVSEWPIGARVATGFFSTWQTGKYQPQHHLAGALGGAQTAGVLAQYIVAKANAIVEVPAHLSLQQAATLPCAAVTAWQALFDRGQLAEGETVLIQGTGGVALFALQLAVAQGARVIITSSSDEKLAKAHALGAWQTINYRKQPDWDQAVLELTAGTGADQILELGGPDTFSRSISAVAGGGHIHQIGVLSGFAPSPNLLPLQLQNATIHGTLVGSLAHFKALNHFISQHKIEPIIDRSFSFNQAQAAFDYLASAQHFGKIIINFEL
ncbi:zinc-dependent alcohol dehydrogenase family protein [Iodobacter fluviatilis]|uniref:Beta-ketoacyl-acyl-carrier-protein synthase I n=1 Tax=Iodobacter fluviatilis TaxID=537 RepID=A0A377Q7H3_9NEIS|nr:NAD(P)-dependent alcohol dehydrogenase [Iodobacter fluviatilis]TCU89407.1 NADPH:quinone reductase-like Zn-dependent oxidoreductase [Iodobacter fluviatilis]STQ90777.1 Beta-ketoacyl-acyl-carrier-protein synthase I [Iodobacter fluviatilis]